MSMIHVSSKAVAGVRATASVDEGHAPAYTSGQLPNRSSDREMTQAWSIGVTESGREWAGKPVAQNAAETCPPEVYIG